MLCVRLLVMVVLQLGPATGFNLASRHATLIGEPHGRVSSLFGYTVHLLAGNTSSVIVGAPRSNSSAHPSLVEPGVVYHCSKANKWRCHPITLDSLGNDFVRFPLRTDYKHKKDNAWIGGAIDVQEDSEGGKIVACGQRWINQRHDNFYLMNGICYVKYYPFESSEEAKVYLPLTMNSHQITLIKETKQEDLIYAYGQAGTSVHWSGDNDILIGAPGVYNWIGTAIRYSITEKYFDEKTTDLDLEDFLTIPTLQKSAKFPENGYLGYSVDSGRFFSSREQVYVAGAPRSGTLRGKIFIFDFPETSEEEIKILIEREGTQLGEYFGACVCAVDLNGDGLDDLVVGAPQHTLGTSGSSSLSGDEGRIYVFINEDGGKLREIGDTNIIMGTQAYGAKFGTTISKIGDINKDGFQDIAVGAPFEEDGRGAIYIYHGRSEGIHQRPSQRISAQEVDTSLRGFGMSISRGADVDGNYYNDVAVGATMSGHAVLIPSQPVVSFQARILSHVERINLTTDTFGISACLSYTGQHVPPTLSSQITLVSDSRANFVTKGVEGRTSNLQSYRSTINRGIESCQDFKVKIKDANPDYTKPIELKMHYTLEDVQKSGPRERRESVSEDFCKWCPVVDPNQNSFVSKKIPYAIACGEDNICQTDLVVEASFVDIDINAPFVLGSQPRARVNVTVSNHGEQAFLLKLNVSLPSETPLSRLPKNCEEILHGPRDYRLLECDISSSLEPSGVVELLLDIDMSRVILTTPTRDLFFSFTLSNAVEEKVPENNIYTLALTVEAVVDISILGTSNQDKGVVAKGTHTFHHMYEIVNNGPSPIQTLGMEFHIPVSIRNDEGSVPILRVFEPVAYFDRQPFQCTAVGGRFASEVKRIDVLSELDESVSRNKRHLTDRPRHRRAATNVQLPANRTLFVDCSGPETTCLVVRCNTSGPFLNTRNQAVVTFKLDVDFEKTRPLLDKRDIISLSSFGRVWIIDLPNSVQPQSGLPDDTTVNSIFFGKLPEESVGPWILPVAILVGILILLLIILGLVKIGFFRRQTNEDEDQRSLHDNTEVRDETGCENSYAATQ